jgi:proline racemase
MAARFARGELALGEAFVHESLIGTLFTGRLTERVKAGSIDAVRPTIAGTAWISGMGQLFLDDSDPFPEGFTVADLWAP